LYGALTCALTPCAHRSQVIEALLDGAFAPGAPHGAAEAHVAMLALATAAIDDRRARDARLVAGAVHLP